MSEEFYNYSKPEWSGSRAWDVFGYAFGVAAAAVSIVIAFRRKYL